jgi:hypothetical protein
MVSGSRDLFFAKTPLRSPSAPSAADTRLRRAGERYKRTGEILPDSAIEEFKKFDSMYLGAIGHPDVKPGILAAFCSRPASPSTSTSTCAP